MRIIRLALARLTRSSSGKKGAGAPTLVGAVDVIVVFVNVDVKVVVPVGIGIALHVVGGGQGSVAGTLSSYDPQCFWNGEVG